jgi:23S rRNA (adenine2030-N6)-methyltransferase
VARAFADPNPLLDDYRAAVQAVNAGTKAHLYPGSPRILAQLLRPQDLLILNEKHPEDAYTLRGVMRDTSAAIHERDAYEFWLAMVPPAPRAGWWWSTRRMSRRTNANVSRPPWLRLTANGRMA